jgi:pyridoxal phosphate enzyme (YggS family)
MSGAQTSDVSGSIKDPTRGDPTGEGPDGSIAANLARVRANIAAACRDAGRSTATVTLVAVCKTHPATSVASALAAGQRHFGENRVQEAATKFMPLAPGPQVSSEASTGPVLHLIGPLQTNKARDAVRLAAVIESLDRPRLADALADAIQREGRSPDLLVQVNTGREPQKSGVDPEQADGFIEACFARFGAALRGLMCVPPATEDPAPHFDALARLAARHGLAELSMGMSADFAIAIRHGATSVRVGSAIFGHRATSP